MIYVDPLFNCMPNAKWRWSQASHLVADTVSELHAFAARLGLKRAWFQSGDGIPHYDLTVYKRRAALRLGASEITTKEMGQRICAWRKTIKGARSCA